MSTDTAVLYVSITAAILGASGVIYYGFKQGFFDFLSYAHYASLVLLIGAGLLTWAAMVWMVSPDKFKVEKKQYISLGISVFISILWWGRYAYTVADNADDNNSSNVKWNNEEEDV